MTELNDDPELQMYSSAVLYVLSAITPPKEFVEQIADGFISTIISSSVSLYRNLETLRMLSYRTVLENQIKWSPNLDRFLLPKPGQLL